ncbi:MAG: small multi-drug export protein, partial [Ignavibacteriaceae bacterium]
LWLFPKISQWLMVKSKLMNKFLTWLFERTRKKTKDKIEKYGDLALIIFVAIPLPNTGAWTGALAAWLFGIPFKKAVPNIFYGVLIAGAVVTLITTGLKNLFP